jgi:hypothetical protein
VYSDGVDPQLCNYNVIVPTLLTLYPAHNCICGEQCSLTTTLANEIPFDCNSRIYPPQRYQCDIETYQRLPNCAQTDDLYVFTEKTSSFTRYPLIKYTKLHWEDRDGVSVEPGHDILPDGYQLPLQFLPNESCGLQFDTYDPLVYLPHDNCNFKWGCARQLGIVGIDEECNTCQQCGQDLEETLQCEVTYTNSTTEAVITKIISDDELILQDKYDVGCFNIDQPSINNDCSCAYYCESVPINTVPDPSYTEKYPIGTELLSDYQQITNSDPNQCFSAVSDDQLSLFECGKPVIVHRYIWCTVSNIVQDESFCHRGYSDPTTDPSYPSLPPSTAYNYIELIAPPCTILVLCMLGNNSGMTAVDVDYYTTLELPALADYYRITEPKSTPIIGENNQYPPGWGQCGDLCVSKCTGDIPIAHTKACFRRVNCILNDFDEVVCQFKQVPFTDGSCDEIDTEYGTQRGALSSRAILNQLIYSSLITSTTCPCFTYCSPTAPDVLENAISFPITSAPKSAPTPYNHPTLLTSIEIDNIKIYPCDFDSGKVNMPYEIENKASTWWEELRADLAKKDDGYGFGTIKRPEDLSNTLTTPTPWDVLSECIKPYARQAVLINYYNTLSPQLTVIEQCGLIIQDSMYTKLSPYVIDPLATNQAQFLCSADTVKKNQIGPLVKDISTANCLATFQCSPTQLPTKWASCIDGTGLDYGFQTCSVDMCGKLVQRNVQCIVQNDKTGNGTMIQTQRDLINFYQTIYKPMLELKYKYSRIFSQLNNLINIKVINTITTTCNSNVPSGEDTCDCQPQYFCAPPGTRLKPSSNWPALLSPCFSSDSSGSLIDTLYGFNNDCPACQNVTVDQSRDIFCRNQNGSFTSSNTPTTPTQCTAALLQFPNLTKKCNGSIQCGYTWRCPHISTGLSSTNWGSNILTHPTCIPPTTFSTQCYLALRAATTTSIYFQGTNWDVSQCVEAGKKLRSPVCVAYTTDANNRMVQISSDIGYDKNCSQLGDNASSVGDFTEIDTSSGLLKPSFSIQCNDYDQCSCPSSIFTGPKCDIAPAITSFSLSTDYKQPQSVIDNGTFIQALENTNISLKWTYSGRQTNSIFFYLRGLYSLSSNQQTLPIFLGSTVASDNFLSLFIPVFTSFETRIESPAQIWAYIGLDTATKNPDGGFKANQKIFIIKNEIVCGATICNLSNLRIWDTSHKYPGFIWSNTVEACSYSISGEKNVRGKDMKNVFFEEKNKIGMEILQAVVLENTTPISSIPNASITGCRCVPSETLQLDSTCTIAQSCQNISFNYKNNETDLFFPNPQNPQNPQNNKTQFSSLALPINPTGTCGPNGYVPIQHAWASMVNLSVPPTCAPQCQCLVGDLSVSSKCQICEKKCHFSSDGGVLDPEKCSCRCNLGFHGDTCELCSAYTLVAINSVSDGFINEIYNDSVKKKSFFHSIAIQIASLLNIAANNVSIEEANIYLKNNSIRFVLTLMGNCNTVPTTASLSSIITQRTDNTDLYSSSADSTSIFSVFPRWTSLLAKWAELKQDESSQSVIIPSDISTEFKNEQDAASNSIPSEIRFFGSKSSLNTNEDDLFDLFNNTIQIDTHTDPQHTKQTVLKTVSQSLFEQLDDNDDDDDDDDNEESIDSLSDFFNNGIFTLTSGTVSLSSLYAPKCVGSACPNGENPYDTVRCFTPTDCIITPPLDGLDPAINDSILYVVVGVVIFVLILLVVFILSFCFCCYTKQQPEDDSTNDTKDGSSTDQSTSSLNSDSSTTNTGDGTNDTSILSTTSGQTEEEDTQSDFGSVEQGQDRGDDNIDENNPNNGGDDIDKNGQNNKNKALRGHTRARARSQHHQIVNRHIDDVELIHL